MSDFMYSKSPVLQTALKNLLEKSAQSGRFKEASEIEARRLYEAEKKELENKKALAEIPERYLNSSFENFNIPNIDLEAFKQIKEFASRINAKIFNGFKKNETCVILGGNGSGKTHLGISVLNAINYNGLYIQSGILCMRLIRARAFKAVKDEEIIIKEIASKRFLIIDEIGRARDVETETHALYDIINLRYEKRLDTCLISNKDRFDLQDYLGSAVVDRIAENCFFAQLKSPSYRRKK